MAEIGTFVLWLIGALVVVILLMVIIGAGTRVVIHNYFREKRKYLGSLGVTAASEETKKSETDKRRLM